MAAPFMRHDPRASAHLRARSTTPMSSTNGSMTQLATETNETGSTGSPSLAAAEPLVLRLRGAHETRSVLNHHAEDDEETGHSTRTTPVTRRRRRIQWDESVIDNEGLGRKKSKVCCIYHKPRAVGESSDESSSSSDEDSSNSDTDGHRGARLSDSESGDKYTDGARPIKGGGRTRKYGRSKGRSHDDNHRHEEGDRRCCDGHNDDNSLNLTQRSGGRGRGQAHSQVQAERRPSPNAYEKMPKYNVQPLLRQPGSEL